MNCWQARCTKLYVKKVEEAFNDLKGWTDSKATVMLIEIRQILEDKSLINHMKNARYIPGRFLERFIMN